ncbi:uncharacterized protein SPSK_10477 [Sporothrix schenckii 1099-18]|uniref:Uncharacterized protein n=1 Tax=Sporothrix schenckii 1099-18 TaxID=1397361 RepID=A0A0F2MDJ8_SPOSC|nr:uncharacterized protein SPSK_10477 [Sporothrix schenckii 1099-18]KJR86216.1 hypothetical protein SPSK_10477 [Sporothrix schenckii 1099-18]
MLKAGQPAKVHELHASTDAASPCFGTPSYGQEFATLALIHGRLSHLTGSTLKFCYLDESGARGLGESRTTSVEQGRQNGRRDPKIPTNKTLANGRRPFVRGVCRPCSARVCSAETPREQSGVRRRDSTRLDKARRALGRPTLLRMTTHGCAVDAPWGGTVCRVATVLLQTVFVKGC